MDIGQRPTYIRHRGTRTSSAFGAPARRAFAAPERAGRRTTRSTYGHQGTYDIWLCVGSTTRRSVSPTGRTRLRSACGCLLDTSTHASGTGGSTKGASFRRRLRRRKVLALLHDHRVECISRGCGRNTLRSRAGATYFGYVRLFSVFLHIFNKLLPSYMCVVADRDFHRDLIPGYRMADMCLRRRCARWDAGVSM